MTKKSEILVVTIAILSAIGIVFLPAISAHATCPDNISSYWKLDETSGPTYADFISDNNGTGTANVTAADGIVNGAQEFNGLDTQINVPADRSFDWYVDESFSIEVWIKRDATISSTEVAVGRIDTTLQWWVGLNAAGKASFVLIDGGGTTGTLIGVGDDIADGNWHHVVAVRDGVNDKILLYVDGEEEGSSDVNYTAGFDSTSSALNIGWLNIDPFYYFGGALDEIALYDRALPQTEIQAHYDDGAPADDYCSGTAPFVPFPDDTISLWDLDETAGPEYADTFGDNNGTGTANVTAADGIVNGAQEFNGLDTQINVPADRSFDWYVDESFSIEVWIKRDATISSTEVAVGRIDTTLQWWVGLNAAGKASFVLIDGGGTTGTLIGVGDDIADGNWHHVVAVRDGVNDKILLYVDGEEEGSSDVNYTAGFDSTSSALNIGWLDLDPFYYFGGALDEIALYDRALPQTEIQAHYDDGLLGIGIDDTDTVGGTAEIIATYSSGIWYWDVAASKWTRMTSSSTDGDIAAGDFSGDGKADVASIWSSGLWYQDGATLDFTRIDKTPPNRVTAGDINGDGRAEIIATYSSGIWYWDVAASKWTRMTSSSTDGDIAAGDFSGDGKADVASIWSSGLWYQDGATLDFTRIDKTPPNRVTAGDINGDGRAEIIATYSSGIWYWDVAASKWTRMTSSSTDGDIAAGDFSGDGKADVASIWSSGLWYQDGATLDFTRIDKTPPNNLTAGDVSGD